MPSIWVSDKDYKTLMEVKTGLEKAREEPVSISKAVSYLLEVVSISAARGGEITRKLERLKKVRTT